MNTTFHAATPGPWNWKRRDTKSSMGMLGFATSLQNSEGVHIIDEDGFINNDFDERMLGQAHEMHDILRKIMSSEYFDPSEKRERIYAVMAAVKGE